jgi:hypothetical protein
MGGGKERKMNLGQLYSQSEERWGERAETKVT